jgi:hypothetical protein
MSTVVLRGSRVLAAITFLSAPLVILAPFGSCAPVDDTCAANTIKLCLPNHTDCACAPKCREHTSDCLAYDICYDGRCFACSDPTAGCECITKMCVPENWSEGVRVEYVENGK